MYRIARRAYHAHVLDHFSNPRNVGSFPKGTPNVRTAVVGAPACGDVLKIQLKVVDNKVIDSRFKTFGCGSAIAASSLATEWVIGKSVEEALEVKRTYDYLQMLAESAIKTALEA